MVCPILICEMERSHHVSLRIRFILSLAYSNVEELRCCEVTVYHTPYLGPSVARAHMKRKRLAHALAGQRLFATGAPQERLHHPVHCRHGLGGCREEAPVIKQPKCEF